MITEILGALAALFFVLGLFGLFAWGVKRSGLLPGHARTKSGQKQIDILETKMIDGRNRLVVASWRGKQFLLGTNPAGMKLLASSDENSKDEFRKLVENDDNS